tara:strand:- start:83 stop:559 length:477 start_codon:yes stop_codon:yes gene_type:complete
MSIIEKLQSLNLEPDALVTLSYSEGTDVFVHNETEVDTALSDTDVVNSFVSLITTPGLRVSNRWSGEVMESLRSDGHLDDYERGSFTFEDYLTEFFTENFYDQEFIEHSTEKYDHKRGFCTLSTEVQVAAKDIVASSPFLSGWTASVVTDNGTLTFSA